MKNSVAYGTIVEDSQGRKSFKKYGKEVAVPTNSETRRLATVRKTNEREKRDMELKNRLEKEEIKLLQDVGIEIKNGQYTIDETGEIIEKLDKVIQDNLDKNENFSGTSLTYEKIQDKILELEEEI